MHVITQTKKCAVTWRCMDTPHDVVCVYTRVHVHVCVCTCAYVRALACDERDKLPFQDNAISLLSPHLIYTLKYFLKAMWDYVFVF